MVGVASIRCGCIRTEYVAKSRFVDDSDSRDCRWMEQSCLVGTRSIGFGDVYSSGSESVQGVG